MSHVASAEKMAHAKKRGPGMVTLADVGRRVFVEGKGKVKLCLFFFVFPFFLPIWARAKAGWRVCQPCTYGMHTCFESLGIDGGLASFFLESKTKCRTQYCSRTCISVGMLMSTRLAVVMCCAYANFAILGMQGVLRWFGKADLGGRN